jgi:WD40 repeat protein
MALTGDWRGGLRLWQVSATEDTPAGTLVRQFGNSERRRGTDAQINALAYSPDGTLVLAGTRGGGLNLWDVATGEVLWAVQANPLSVWSVAFTPDGRFALSPTDGDHVALWSVETGERWRILESAGGTVYDLAISPDGRYVAAAHEDGTLSLWELRNGALTTLDGHDIAVQSVAFSPDGTRLASGADDGTLMLWDVATGVPTREWGEGEGVFEIVWNADGTLLLTGARGGEGVLWDAATGERRSTYNHHQQDVYSVHFAPDGVTGFSAADDLRFVQWALADGTVTRVFGGDAGHADTAPLFGLAAYTSDGAGRVIAAADDGTLTVWNTEAGAPLLTLRGHQFAVNAVDVHPDTALAVSVGVDGTVRVWNLATGELLHTLYGHVGSVTSVAFSPDGRTAASSGTDGVILLWDVEHGRQIRTLFGFEAASVYDIAFSPDGQRLAAGSSDPDAFVTLWDVERGELLHRMSGHTNTVFSVAFSPDGSTLASGGGDNLIILWDAATGAPVRTFASGHALAINSVAYSPDGTLLVSGGLDNLVMLWDVATGQVLRVLEGHTDSVNIATFMPDGETAVSAGGDFTIRLWQIPSLDTLLAWTLENRAVRPLTCDERRLYGVTPPCDAAGNLPTAEVTPPPPATSTPEPTRAPSVTPVLTPTPTLTPLAPRAAQPGEQRGELVAGTSDVWTFDGEVGMRVTISVIADQPSRDPEEGLDTFLRVFAPDGTLLDENDDILSAENPNSELTVMLRANGAYTLVVASYGFAGGGGYTLTVRED